MLNHITIMGRIVKDLELRRTQSGHAVCSFTLAVPRDFREQDGSKAVDWINCIAWRQSAEYICKYGKKGRLLALEGRLQSREYTDRNGVKKTAWEVTANNIYFADKDDRDASGDTTRDASGDTKTEGIAEIEEDGDLPF